MKYEHVKVSQITIYYSLDEFELKNAKTFILDSLARLGLTISPARLNSLSLAADLAVAQNN